MLKLLDASWTHALQTPVLSYLDRLESFLAAVPEQLSEEIRPLATYCISHSGKRLRPLFTFYSAFKAPHAEDLVKAAAVLELIHLATLIHDDVLDNGTIRHKMPTLHVEYGSDIAILMGDALFAHGLYLASSFPTPTICRLVSQSTARLCAGEISQTLSQKSQRFSLEHYYKIIDLKTADLFATACHIGASLSPSLDAVATHKLTLFGRYLGRAYQIYDDMNDILGQEALLGKTLGTDFASQKYTLPILLYLEELSLYERSSTIEELLQNKLSAAALVHRLEHTGTLQKVKEAFHNTLNEADTIIQGLPHQQQLLDLSWSLRQLFP